MPEPIRNYSKLARDIIVAVGGEENITNVSRCTTRLRLVLKETPKDAKEKISSMPAVITVVEKGGQFQIVIGTHVGEVFDVIAKELNLDAKQNGVVEVKESLLNRIIATMSAVFAPFVYILASAGLIQGCLIIITQFAPDFVKTGTYEVISFISWTPFTFLPIFIGITASKHFKCNTYIAIACCCALVNPTWNDMASRIANGETIKFLIFNLSETTYTSTVLPPLFLVLILSYLERLCQKILPDVIKSLGTPFICLLIMVPATIVVIGPISDNLARAIAAGYNFIYYSVPALAALVIGGFWQVVVIFGVHWGITPVVLADFANNGSNSFQAFQTCAVVAQAAAAFGVFLKTRNKELKRVAFSAGLTGVFGITEPAIYGVTLRFKKPFICGCIAGAIGAAVSSFFGSMYYIYSGLPGLLTIVNAISPKNPSSFIGEIVGCGIAIIGSIVLVQIIGFDEPTNSDIADNNDNSDSAEEKSVSGNESTVVYSPLNGEIKELKDVNDETFSGGMMGKGVAIIPSEGKLYAPFDCTVTSIFDTKHAIGFEDKNGIEILVHIGLETVSLGGKYFETKVNVQDKVKKGQLIAEFDLENIKKDFDIITPIIITNTDECSDIILEKTSGNINAGDSIISIRK